MRPSSAAEAAAADGNCNRLDASHDCVVAGQNDLRDTVRRNILDNGSGYLIMGGSTADQLEQLTAETGVSCAVVSLDLVVLLF